MTFDLASLGWDAEFAAAYAKYRVRGHHPARVMRMDRGIATVQGATGVDRASLGGAHLLRAGRDPLALPCAGDWVVVRTWPDKRVTLEAVLPRRTQIVRANRNDESCGQILAANVDVAAIVEPMDPAPDFGRVERLLSLAWDSGAHPVVLLTKADLVASPDLVAAPVADAAPGVDVYPISAERGMNVDVVRSLVAPGRTLALLGASGSGKSTLVNTLAGATVMATQQIRRADGRGRHTTTYRSLVPLPGLGAILDTPGLRAVGVFDGGVDEAFRDIEEIAADCRFSDCQHNCEPECAVWAAVENGDLSRRRLDSWRKLQRELVWRTRRREARAAARAATEWKFRSGAEMRIIRRVRES
ncbi:MAG TPA: ribosome small subunit-dependent GTPase A [Micromonosporaceae bacterium]|nr:ribosome small subunit-dependent GTPase A [Micromonosporaceae bacterium]